MSPAANTERLTQAIVDGDQELRSLLFVWLTGEPGEDLHYLAVGEALQKSGQADLARLVAHRGLDLFPDSDKLSLFTLGLEFSRRPKAA